MAISGQLSEFSLPELFQFLEQGKKTGLLTLKSAPDLESGLQSNHYIWLRQGRIVAAANSLDNQGLIKLIVTRKWLSDRVVSKMAQVRPDPIPMGLYLKSQALLNAEQLKILFYAQVMQQVCALFTLKDGKFKFDSKAILPMAEMTGLSTTGNKVTLAGLRNLRDWSALADKMPAATSGLISLINDKPKLSLNKSEWQVWEYTNGTVELEKIAEQLRLPLDKVLKIAFRLILVGIAEEVPVVVTPTTNLIPEIPSQQEMELDGVAQKEVSQSFLQNLVGFLRTRV